MVCMDGLTGLIGYMLFFLDSAIHVMVVVLLLR